jgi:hypothetical protein
MKHLWSLICQNVITSQETNSVTLVEVIEELKFSPNENPGAREMIENALREGNFALPVNFSLVTTWLRSNPESPESAQVRVDIKAPNGDILTQQGYSVDFSEHARLRARTVVPILPFKGDGTYQFVVYHKVGNEWQEDVSIPLAVSESPSANLSGGS